MTCESDSATWVKNNRPGKFYAPVSVTIGTVTGSGASMTVSFTAISQGSKISVTGVPWNDSNVDIWTKCPSTIPTPPAGTGILYLESAFLSTHSINETPKWPTSLAGPAPVEKLRVWPTHVIVRGYELRDGTLHYGAVDILDPELALTIQNAPPGAADPQQQIILNGGAVTLSLTSKGFSQGFAQAFPTSHLKEAVEAIKRGTDATGMASAWSTIATWVEMSKTRPSMITAESRHLLSEVLDQSAL